MRTANTHKNMARCAATATLACVLGLGLAAPAYADTASDLAAARTKLEQIGTQTQQIYDELATQTQALDQTAGEITQSSRRSPMVRLSSRPMSPASTNRRSEPASGSDGCRRPERYAQPSVLLRQSFR